MYRRWGTGHYVQEMGDGALCTGDGGRGIMYRRWGTGHYVQEMGDGALCTGDGGRGIMYRRWGTGYSFPLRFTYGTHISARLIMSHSNILLVWSCDLVTGWASVRHH